MNSVEAIICSPDTGSHCDIIVLRQLSDVHACLRGTWGSGLTRGDEAVGALARRGEGLLPAVLLAAPVSAAGGGNPVLQL